MFASIVSSITSLLSGLNSHAKKFETTSDRLDEVMRTEEFPKALQARAAIYAQSSTVPVLPVEPTDCAVRTVPLLVVAQLTELTVGAAPVR